MLENTHSFILNTTMQKFYNSDGILAQIWITPNEGYVLHDKMLDYYMEYDQSDNGIGDVILGFYAGTKAVKFDYDFAQNEREFYAVPKNEISQNAKIF